MRFTKNILLFILLLCCSVLGARAQDTDCDSNGCYYDDSWGDLNGTFGSTASDGSGPSFDVTLTMVSPTGSSTVVKRYCINNQAVDAYQDWIGNGPGDYTFTAQYSVYYTLSGYTGCWGTPGLLLPHLFDTSSCNIVSVN